MLFRRFTVPPNGPMLPAVALRAAAILLSGRYAAAHDSNLRPMTMPTTAPTIEMKLAIRSACGIVLAASQKRTSLMTVRPTV